MAKKTKNILNKYTAILFYVQAMCYIKHVSVVGTYYSIRYNISIYYKYLK